MKTHSCIASCLLFVAASVQAAGFDPAEFRCKDGFGGDNDIRRIVAELEWAAVALPGVPPEEAAFLKSEHDAALVLYRESTPANGGAAQSDARLAAIAQRPLYSVWSLRNELEPARVKMAQILTPTSITTYMNNDQASRFELAAQAAHSLNRYVTTLSAFVEREKFRPTVQLSDNQVSRLHIQVLEAIPTLANFMSCKMARVMGPQK